MWPGCEYDNHKCHNKTPRCDWGVNDIMPGSDVAENLVILKKS